MYSVNKCLYNHSLFTFEQKIVDYKIECLLFGGQISRSFRFMEEAVMNELSDIAGLRITTVSDFSNAAFKGLVKMLKDQ